MSAARNLGATALLLGIAAPFAGEPASSRTAIDVAGLAQLVASQRDHVTALQLARWIRDRKAGLRVIDVRSRAEFAKFAIPTAEAMPIEEIPSAKFGGDDTVILYSEGGAHAAQAWVFLKAMGVRNVYFVAGGLADWLDDVINPVLRADATPADRAAFAETAELSQYFGGSPRAALPGESPSGRDGVDGDVGAAVTQTRRRGC